MPRGFDSTFFLGLVFVIGALAVAWLALTGRQVPLVGAGRGALIAVGLIGLTGCAIAGVSQTTTYGWTHPVMLVGVVLGIASLAVVGAGLFAWDGLVRPITALGGPSAFATATTEELATILLAGIIALKFFVNFAFSLTK